VRQLAAALKIANKNKGGSELPHSKGFASFDKNYAALGEAPALPGKKYIMVKISDYSIDTN